MKSFLIALQFLTILPVKIKSKIAKKDFCGSLTYFPLVGVVIGILLCFVLLVFGFLPKIFLAALMIAVLALITGGIHLDGFADTCDGFCGSKQKERTLDIMRDSHIGSMGAIGLVSLLLLKFTLITSIEQDILWKGLIMMLVFSRWAQVLACYLSEYLHQEGKAKYFIGNCQKRELFLASGFSVGLFLLLMQAAGLILFFAAAVIALVIIKQVNKRIGGMTGDTVGAVSEITEVVILLFYLFYQRLFI